MGVGRKGVRIEIHNGILYWDFVKGRLEGKGLISRKYQTVRVHKFLYTYHILLNTPSSYSFHSLPRTFRYSAKFEGSAHYLQNRRADSNCWQDNHKAAGGEGGPSCAHQTSTRRC